MTTLYQCGVDNLNFTLRMTDVVMADDQVRTDKPQNHGGVVCSTENCDQPGVRYCKQSEFLCQQCYDISKFKGTKSHRVVRANDGEASSKSEVLTYPSCHRHNHEVMNLYCCTCHSPICTNSSHDNHKKHEICELDKQAQESKNKVEQICEETDGLITVIKQAINTTRSQVNQAETDIVNACDDVKATYKRMHDKLNEEETQMMSDLHAARRQVKTVGEVTLDSQMTTMGELENLKACQAKLSDKDSVCHCVTVTDSMQRDIEHYFNSEVPCIMWNNQIERKTNSDEKKRRVDMHESTLTDKVEVMTDNKKVEMKGSAASDKPVEVKEVSRIRLHAQDTFAAFCMAVHHQHIYAVNQTGLIVYCYTPDGSLSHKYEHRDGQNAGVRGMCLMIDGDTASLVISSVNQQALIWISIIDDVIIKHHHTQRIDYSPAGSYNDKGDLMVCDPDNHRIHRYTHDGQTLAVINLPDNVRPCRVTRHGDGDLYVVSDWFCNQVVVIDVEGHVTTRHSGAIQGVNLGLPSDINTFYSDVLIADMKYNQVLLLRRTGDVVKILDQHVRSPRGLYLDTDHQRLYVSGLDQHQVLHVFIFDYKLITGNKELTMKTTKLDMKVTF